MQDLRMERYVSGGTEFRCWVGDRWYWVNVQHGCRQAHGRAIGDGPDIWLDEDQVAKCFIAGLRREGLLVGGGNHD